MHLPRKQKLINRRLQLGWGAMAAMALGFCLFIQSMILVVSLRNLAVILPEDGDLLLAEIPSTLMISLALTTFILVPFVIYLAVVVSLRVAGPVHHMEQHLKAVLANQQVDDCKLRKHDHFHELCSLMNAVISRQNESTRSENVDDQKAA